MRKEQKKQTKRDKERKGWKDNVTFDNKQSNVMQEWQSAISP